MKRKFIFILCFQTGPVIPMPVPSSYNDVTQDKLLRDFTGWVWYDREFFVPLSWKGQRVVVRVDSARCYSKMVRQSQTYLTLNLSN